MHPIVLQEPTVVEAKAALETWRSRADDLRTRCDEAARAHEDAKTAALLRGEAFAPSLVPIDVSAVNDRLKSAEAAWHDALRAAPRRRLPELRARERDILQAVLDTRVRELEPLIEELASIASTMSMAVDARTVNTFIESGRGPAVRFEVADVVDTALAGGALLDKYAAKLEVLSPLPRRVPA